MTDHIGSFAESNELSQIVKSPKKPLQPTRGARAGAGHAIGCHTFGSSWVCWVIHRRIRWRRTGCDCLCRADIDEVEKAAGNLLAPVIGKD